MPDPSSKSLCPPQNSAQTFAQGDNHWTAAKLSDRPVLSMASLFMHLLSLKFICQRVSHSHIPRLLHTEFPGLALRLLLWFALPGFLWALSLPPLGPGQCSPTLSRPSVSANFLLRLCAFLHHKACQVASYIFHIKPWVHQRSGLLKYH